MRTTLTAPQIIISSPDFMSGLSENAESGYRYSAYSEYVVVLVLGILGAAVAGFNTNGGLQVPTSARYFAFLPLVLLVMVYLQNSRYRKGAKAYITVSNKLFLFQFAPFLVVYLYTVMVAATNETPAGLLRYATILLVQIGYRALVTGCLLIMFGKRAPEIIFKGLVLSYVVALIYAYINIGTTGFEAYFSQMDTRGVYHSYFELHDLGLTVPFFMFYYVYQSDVKHRAIKLLACALVAYIAHKRIAILAAGLIIITYLVFRVLKRKPVYQVGLLIGTLSILWLYLANSSDFSGVMNGIGLNVSGRSYIYTFLAERFRISVTHPGCGLGYIRVYLGSIVNGDIIGIRGMLGAHNDIFRIYLEAGFAGLLIWLAYTLLYAPSYITSRFGNRCAWLYTLLCIYAFTTYFTDNTLTYYCFQLTLYSILGGEMLQYTQNTINIKGKTQ